MAGPLDGVRIIELAAIGPVPFAGMLLADHGAEVIRIERPGAAGDARDPLLRSRKRLVLDLRNPPDVRALRGLVETADGLMEGFRPGVMERLGLGPDVLRADNPALVYGRMTGWGQTGPLAPRAGHDINYIAVSGVLGALGRAGEPPVPPINLIGDFGGGGMLLAFGMLAALFSAQRDGKGQVIDCAMTEGSALLMAMVWGFRSAGCWNARRGSNLLDGGAPFYGTYATRDGKYVAIGAIEPQFYAILREGLGLADDPLFDVQDDPALWPAQKTGMARAVARYTQAELVARFAGRDACVTPVLPMADAPDHPHNLARESFVSLDGVVQPAPAPRYSRTPCVAPQRPVAVGMTELTEGRGNS